MNQLAKQLRDYATKLNQAADLVEGKIQTTTKTPRTLSQAARHKISIAQRKRWKVFHGGKRAA